MENIDKIMFNNVNTNKMHKSAIIYRDDSASFIYVCFHCGRMFKEINETLLHIESHFQMANVVVDQLTEDGNGENVADSFAVTSAPETVDVKLEIQDDNDIDDGFAAKKSNRMNEDNELEFRCKICNLIQPSEFLIRIHALNAHIQEPMVCSYCTSSFKTSDEFENHLKLHIARREVNWKSVTDGIKTVMQVDWSVYEPADSKCSENDDKVIKEKPKKIPSPKELPTVNRNQSESATVRPYRCHKCPLTCRNMTLLRNHMKTHADDELLEIYQCKECDCYFKNAYALRIHVLGFHLHTKRFTCNACSVQFNFSQSKQFEEHLQLHNDGPDSQLLWTDIKDGIYHQMVDLSKYEEIDSCTEQQFACEFCTQRFYIKCNLDVHIKSIHSGQRRLQCAECYSIFATPKYYFAHQLEHQRVGPTIVERDDNVLLANLDAVIDERIIYHGDEFSEQPFRCLICNVTFNVHHDIRSHIRRKHVYKMFPPPLEPKKEFICDLCGMLLKSKFAVKKHLLIHTNTKSHGCSFCGKMFRLSSTRKIHERQHTGEKPFQCHECGKAFISRGLLTAHKKSHDDTTYPCHICGKAFNLPSGYRNHIKTHREDRSFKCTVCEKTFNTRLYLTRHMAIHNDRQYQCRFCESKFNTSDGQRQHQRHKHKHELMLLK